MMHADQGLWPLGLMARGDGVGGGLGLFEPRYQKNSDGRQLLE